GMVLIQSGTPIGAGTGDGMRPSSSLGQRNFSTRESLSGIGPAAPDGDARMYRSMPLMSDTFGGRACSTGQSHLLALVLLDAELHRAAQAAGIEVEVDGPSCLGAEHAHDHPGAEAAPG